MPVGAVKAFNEGILLGLTRLNVFEFYPLAFAPFRKDGSPQFRPVVHAE